MGKEQRARAPDLGAFGLLRNQKDEVALVGWRGLWSLPGGHHSPKLGDRTLEETFFREMEEELGVKKDRILYFESLGTLPLQKDKNSPKKLFEIFYGEVSQETSKRIRYREKEEHLLVWVKTLKALRLNNLDIATKQALGRFMQRSFHRKIIRRRPL
jgi:ADP-ribose pyrophosphatase YjhB (NUDIX family)